MTRPLEMLWGEVVASALLGSERRPFAPPVAAPDRLGVVLAGLAGSDPSRALLGAAAAVALYRRVGRLPVTEPRPLPEPCAPDETPACGIVAAERLKRMLGGEHPEVLPEWLASLAASGKRVAEDCLAPLLERGRTDPALRSRIEPVLGRRGHWLAAQNAEWAFAEDETANEAAWETGTRAERLALLRRLRRDLPDNARALVESTWAEDTPEDRAAFIGTFANRLNMADEPFLEAALDDRRKDVRSTAADLLARLPQSRLAARMKARVVAMLTLTGGKQPTLEASIPDACDKATERDGIDPKLTAAAKSQAMGEKAWRLYQMLGAVPPSTWPETFGTSPEALVAAADSSEWKLVLLKGWAVAARRYHDPDWADALVVRSTVPSLEPQPQWLAPNEVQGLMDAIPVERREAIVLKLLRAQPGALTNAHPAIPLLHACRHAWSPTFAFMVLDRIRNTLRSGDANIQWHLAQLMPQLGQSIPADLATVAADDWPTESQAWAYWSNQVNALVSLLQFRHEMLTELTS